MTIALDSSFPSVVVRLASIARGAATHGPLESLLHAVGGRTVYDNHLLCVSYMGSSQDYGRCQAVLTQRGLRQAQPDWPDGDWAEVDPDSNCWMRQYHPPWLGLGTYEFLTPHTMARAGIRPSRAAALAWAARSGAKEFVMPRPSSVHSTNDGVPQTIALLPGRLGLLCGDWQTCTDDVLICLGPSDEPELTGIAHALCQRAGPGLQRAWERVGSCPPGNVQVTAGFALAARWLVYGSAPRLTDAPGASLVSLADGYRHALLAALRLQARRVTVVPLDTRCCNIPLWLAADVALTQCRQFLAQSRSDMDITLLVDSYPVEDVFAAAAQGDPGSLTDFNCFLRYQSAVEVERARLRSQWMGRNARAN